MTSSSDMTSFTVLYYSLVLYCVAIMYRNATAVLQMVCWSCRAVGASRTAGAVGQLVHVGRFMVRMRCWVRYR